MAEQLELLRRIAGALGVTLPASVRRPTVGMLYVSFKKTQSPGRPWQLVRALLRPFVLRFWRTPAESLTAAMWAEHIAKRKKEPTRTYRAGKKLPKGSRPPQATTLNLERMRALQLLNFGVDNGVIDKNPLARTKPLKARKGRDTRLTEDQFEKLIANADVLEDDRPAKFRALITAMCDAMMRIGEARRIRRDRIGLDGRYVIPASQSKNGEARIVTFTRDCLAAFAAVPVYPGSPYVIPSQRNGGRPYDANALRDWVYLVAEKAGLNAFVADGDVKIKPHDIRATGASIADERGAPIRLIQQALGHKHAETTLRYIRRARYQDANAMAAIMEERRGPRRVAQPNSRNEEIFVDVSSATVVRKSS